MFNGPAHLRKQLHRQFDCNRLGFQQVYPPKHVSIEE